VFNQYEYTRACLQTVSGLAYPNRETIVVDNASTDSTPLLLPREFPWVRIERNEANLGFAGGCNVGIRAARGTYVFLLNNDTRILDTDLLDVLLKTLESDDRIAAVGPRIVDYDDPAIVTFDGEEDAYGLLPISGSALLVRRRALEEVGLFDESFFAYYEDRDLFGRLRTAGWTLRHVPTVRLAHRGSATSVPRSPLYHYYHNRNLLVLLRRHARARDVLLRAFPKWAWTNAWFVKASVERRDRVVLRAWFRGLRDGLRASIADQPRHGPPLGP